MLALLVAVVVTAVPTRTIALPNLRYSGLTADEGNALLEFFADRLAKASGAQVVTPAMIATSLGAERQRQLLGCDENASACFGEFANALGADLLMTGSIVKLGAGFTVALTLVDSRTGQATLSASERLSNEDALSSWLAATAEEWGLRLSPGLRKRSVAPFVVGGAGVLLGALAAVSFGVSAGLAGQLRLRPSAFSSAAEIDTASKSGSTFQALGWVGAAVGVAALAAGVVWWLLDAPQASAAFEVSPTGLAWRLP